MVRIRGWWPQHIMPAVHNVSSLSWLVFASVCCSKVASVLSDKRTEALVSHIEPMTGMRSGVSLLAQHLSAASAQLQQTLASQERAAAPSAGTSSRALSGREGGGKGARWEPSRPHLHGQSGSPTAWCVFLQQQGAPCRPPRIATRMQLVLGVRARGPPRRSTRFTACPP